MAERGEDVEVILHPFTGEPIGHNVRLPPPEDGEEGRVGSGDFSIGSDLWPGTSKVLEEMGELGQVLGKLMGTAGRTDHWDGTDLAVRAVEETGDLIAAIEFWSSVNLTIEQRQDQAKRAVVKRRQFEEWHYEQAEQAPRDAREGRTDG